MAEHERFILGQGESGRLYLVHTQAPRFVAEIFPEDEAPVTGLSLVIPETFEVVANFSCIDHPGGCDVRALRDQAAEFLLESDFRGEAEIEAARRRGEV